MNEFQVSIGGGTEGVPLQYGELNVEFLSVFVFEGFIRTCQYVLVNNAVGEVEDTCVDCVDNPWRDGVF